MTFAHSHFYTGLVLETYIHFIATLIYDRHTFTFGTKSKKIIQVFNNHYMPQEYYHKYLYIIITVHLYNLSKIAYKGLGSARHLLLRLLLFFTSLD
jgi:hypothetical protein